MGRLVVTAPFADMNLHPFLNEWLVWIDGLTLQTSLVPNVPFVIFQRPRREIKTFKFIFRNPGCRVVRDGFGKVTSRTLHQTQISDSHYGKLTNVNSVSEDSFGIDLADCRDKCFHDLNVTFFQIPFIRSHLRRFVNQIKTESTIRNFLVTSGEDLPMKDCCCQCFVALCLCAGKEISRFELAFIYAIAGDAMKVEVDVNAILSAKVDCLINLLEWFFIDE